MNAPTRSQRGLTMVELLIGMVIGLFIVAAATSLLTGSLRENRRLMIESRLMQDLRTAANVVSRDLRRAGYWGAASAGVWTSGVPALLPNPNTALAPDTAASDAVSFRFSRDTAENNAVDPNEQFGFRLRNGAIELQLGAGNWQALTDSGTLAITAFSVTPTVQDIALAGACAGACPAGSPSCPPHQLVRSLALVITGHAATDASVARSVRANVRLRNDAIVGACPA